MALSLAIVPTRVLTLLVFLEVFTNNSPLRRKHRKVDQKDEGVVVQHTCSPGSGGEGERRQENKMITVYISLMGSVSNGPPSTTRIAVVTGGNKGIGLEVCRQLAGNGRDEARGAAAAEKLRALGLSNVVFHQLDITDAPSVARLAHFLKDPWCSCQVNNAGIVGLEYLQDHIDGTPTTDEEKFVGMGMDQRLELLLKCESSALLLPLLLASADGRVVNVSSEFGQLRHFGSADLRRELADVETLTEERLDEVVSAFVSDLDSGAGRGGGAALNAYSRVLARRHPSLRVNCVHPGFVRTDMTVNLGLVAPEEGARRDRRQAPFV
ncbi:hypothetical protein BS78_01G038600 [Paspalum vaginatum]|nr:hypothetical protein BS78_01G038600 [Paspalum vaginatum]